MKTYAPISSKPVSGQGFLAPVEGLVLACLIAAIALGAVMSARLLHQRMVARNPAIHSVL
jgi:hypothetical protein